VKNKKSNLNIRESLGQNVDVDPVEKKTYEPPLVLSAEALEVNANICQDTLGLGKGVFCPDSSGS